ncbi:MAG: methyltransferase domain-containing protein [Burkholderiales bacterium]|nr:methyltransferase domain-containing protein [Burkholderiales bacterium]
MTGFRILALCAVLGAAPVLAQKPAAPYQPKMGQKGKDVVWIPSPDAMVERMLDMARVSSADFVVDLGSGDGRNVIAAAKRGARALGVEYNLDLVELSKRNAAAAGVSDRASFVQGDMFAADVSGATTLILFLIPDNLRRLEPSFRSMKPGSRIVSNTYEIGGGWEPDLTETLPLCASWCSAHLYIVPAKVDGTWRMDEGMLSLEQFHQVAWGTYETNGIFLPVEEGRLAGRDITFTVNRVRYEARVNGRTMEGVAKGRETRPFRAVLQ